MLGRMTPERTLPAIRKFVEDGGTVVGIGASASLGESLGLPLANFLVERSGTGTTPLSRTKYYVPGAVLKVALDLLLRR